MYTGRIRGPKSDAGQREGAGRLDAAGQSSGQRRRLSLAHSGSRCRGRQRLPSQEKRNRFAHLQIQLVRCYRLRMSVARPKSKRHTEPPNVYSSPAAGKRDDSLVGATIAASWSKGTRRQMQHLLVEGSTAAKGNDLSGGPCPRAYDRDHRMHDSLQVTASAVKLQNRTLAKSESHSAQRP